MSEQLASLVAAVSRNFSDNNTEGDDSDIGSCGDFEETKAESVAQQTENAVKELSQLMLTKANLSKELSSWLATPLSPPVTPQASPDLVSAPDNVPLQHEELFAAIPITTPPSTAQTGEYIASTTATPKGFFDKLTAFRDLSASFDAIEDNLHKSRMKVKKSTIDAEVMHMRTEMMSVKALVETILRTGFGYLNSMTENNQLDIVRFDDMESVVCRWLPYMCCLVPCRNPRRKMQCAGGLLYTQRRRFG